MSSHGTKGFSIEQLPVEMLLKVFEFLESKDLLNSALVNKKWNDIIASNCVTMKHLPLSLEGPWQQINKSTKAFKRKYHTIKVDYSTNWNEDTMKVFRKHGTEVRCLEFNECEFQARQFKLFSRLLRTMTQLEVLKLNNCDIDYFKQKHLNKLKPVNLLHLKKVVLHESDETILKFISPSQLTSLKINGNNNLEDDGDIDWVFDFLRDQNVLKELALRNLGFSGDLEKTDGVKFRLQKLSLRKVTSLSDDDENIQMFVKKFDKTLEELELVNNRFSEDFYKMIFKDFQKLKVLKVDLKGAPNIDSFYHNLRQNNSIKQLIIQIKSSKDLEAAEGFIGNLPKITDLVLEGEDDIPQSLLLFISNNLLMLQSLTLNSIKGPMMSSIRITSLKSLYIKNLPALRSEDWKQIIKALPNVEKLSIKRVTDAASLNDRNFNIITKKLKNLTHVQIGYGFVAIKRIFNQLLNNCKNLKIVEILEDAFVSAKPNKEAIVKDFKRDGLKFYIFSPNQMHNVFTNYIDLWSGEKAAENYDDSDDDESDLENQGYEVGAILALVMNFQNGIPLDSSDSENDDIYFDSDGEMRHWMEDPGDYGYGDEYYDVD